MSLLKAKQKREEAVLKEEARQKALTDAKNILEGAEGSEITPEQRTKIDGFKASAKDLKGQAEQLRSDAELYEMEATENQKRDTPQERIIPGAAGGKSEIREKQKLINGYSFKNAVSAAVSKRAISGIEAEMHQEADKEARESGFTLQGSNALPSWFMSVDKRWHGYKPEYRDHTSGTDADGGYTVAQDLGGLIPVLRPRLKTIALGARVLSGLTGNLDIPRDTTNWAATWKAENATAAELTAVLDDLNLTPNRLTAFADISRTLLTQSSINFQSFVIDKINFSVANALDAAGLNGSGASNQPQGLLGTTGIGDVAGGTNGAAPDFADIIDLETQVAQDDADVDTMAYLTTPGMRGKLKKALIDAGSGLRVWDRDGLNGYRAEVSTKVPSTLDKGTSTGVCHSIILGNWRSMLYAQWGGIDLIVNPYTKGKEGLIEIIVHSNWDVGIEHPESFAAMQDALV